MCQILGWQPSAWIGPWGVPPLGGAANHGEATEAMYGWALVETPNIGGAEGSGDCGVGGINQMEA